MRSMHAPVPKCPKSFMGVVIPLVIAGLCLSVTAHAQSVNQTFLGVSKDSTRAEVSEKLECKFHGNNDHCIGSFYVPISETRNDRIEVFVRFAGEKFADISFEAKSEKAGQYFSMLTEKYGKPTKREITSVQNRMGARFEKIDLIWKLKGATILATNIGNTVTEGFFSYQSTEGVKLLGAKEKESRKNVF